MRRIWVFFDGTGRRTAVGFCVVALGVLLAAVVLSSRGGWQWFDGMPLAAQENGGVVVYSYRGQNYSLDDTSSVGSGPRTVWINPQNPWQATLYSLTVAQVTDSLFVGIPVVLGGALAASGFVLKYRRGRSPTRM